MKQILCLLLLLQGVGLFAQSDEDENYYCKHHIGVGAMYMNLQKAATTVTKTAHTATDMKMLHVHYTYMLRENVGVGMQVGASPSHWEEPMFGATAEYKPLYHVALTVAPSIHKYHDTWKWSAASGIRYDYYVGHFMVSPNVGWMYMNGHHFIGGGIHVGKHF